MDTMTKSGSKVAPVEEPAKGAGDAAPGAAGAGTATGGDASPSDAAAGAGEETKKSKAKRKKTEGGAKRKESKGKNKKVISFEGYWVKDDGVGNRFLRDAFGGHGHEDIGADEWEFKDVAAALVSSKMKGIQNLHDNMAPQIASGASYADLADSINIPDRVFLIPMLIAAFDKSIADKKIKAWVPPVKEGEEMNGGVQPLGHYADHDHGAGDAAERVEEMEDDGGSPMYRAKGWNDIAKQAGVGNKRSSACTIL